MMEVMRKEPFTQGDWRSEGPDMFGDYNIIPIRQVSAVAAVVSNLRSVDEVAANARLVAAAPKLVRLLEECLDYIPNRTDGYGDEIVAEVINTLTKIRGQRAVKYDG